MTAILIIHKEGLIEECTLKSHLYVACNYRNGDNFELLYTYSDIYEVYGKRKGKPGCENKYEFLPPIDKETYFGKLCIIKKDKDLTLEEWSNYEKKYVTDEILTESDAEPETTNDAELSPEEYETE